MAKKDKGAYAVEQERPKGAATTPRLKQQYLDSIVPALKEKFNYKNPMMVPKLEKIVINMGVGEGSRDIKVLDAAMDEMTLITGQRPNIRRAKKSIANFKIREEMPLGCSVTLRGARMYEFLDRFINIACPRIRDFRGLPRKSFDGRGNYNMGLQEQLIFMEIDPSSLPQTRGMNLTAVTSAKTDAEAMELLKLFGMPFREN